MHVAGVSLYTLPDGADERRGQATGRAVLARLWFLLRMPVSWELLFRAIVALLMTAHVFYFYLFARAREATAGGSALFALAMLVPLAWAVAISDLPEIYRRGRRHRRWEQGRCPGCGYPVRAGGGDGGCPECGTSMDEPRPYRFTWATIRRFAFLVAAAWVIGCGAAETWRVWG